MSLVPPTPSHLAEAISQFSASAADQAARPLGEGNINDTWLVGDGDSCFVLQRLNRQVFTRPLEVVTNFATVTDHINAGQTDDRPLLCAQALVGRDGQLGWQDPAGEVWRAQSYLAAIRTVPCQYQLESLGRILARFHQRTADLSIARLHVPIAGFHCTPRYLADFDKVTSSLVLPGGADFRFCQKSIAAFRPMAGVLEEAASGGRLPRRTTHGDPKIDNFIVDGQGEALGLIDLDTVGPGLLPYDLGDCLRSSANPASELTPEADQVRFDLDRCAALLAGYRRESGPACAWKSFLYEGILLISYELGLRFVTDHLQGDSYFKVSQHGENLHRAMLQFRLVASIASQQERLRRLITAG